MKKHRASKFKYGNYNNLDKKGIYCFWLGKRCIYIGKAQRQTLAKRLEQHRVVCHNDSLELFLNVYGNKMSFCYLPISNSDKINEVERKFIARLQPKCNKYLK